MVMIELPVEGGGGGGGGTITGGLNVNVGGVGVFSATSGATLQFRGIDVGSTRLSVVLDVPTQRIIIDAIEANFSLQNLGGLLTIAKGGTNSSAALNNNRIMVSSGGAIVEAAALTNGQMLIGSTGAAPVAALILGTANQVIVTPGAGSLTLSLPQSIGTGSSPTFAGLTIGALSGPLRATAGVVGTGAINLATEVTGVLPAGNTGIASLSYLTVNNDAASLPNSRQLSTSSPFFFTDGGAGGALSINLYDPSRWARFFQEDFIVSAVGGTAFTANTSGAGASASFNDSDTNHPGVAALATGTTATGRASLNIGGSSQVITLDGTMRVLVYVSARPPALSNGTDTYTIRLGLGDSGNDVESVDGVFFRYTDAVAGGDWEAVTRSNNTETATDTGVPPVATTYQYFKIDINETGTSANFYINDTLVATNTTNIPIGTSRAVGPYVQIIKSVGTATRILRVDYIYVTGQWSVGR